MALTMATPLAYANEALDKASSHEMLREREQFVDYMATESTDYLLGDDNFPYADFDDTYEFVVCAIDSIIDHFPKPPDRRYPKQAKNVVKFAAHPHKPIKVLGAKEIDDIINFGFRPCRRELPENMPEFWK